MQTKFHLNWVIYIVRHHIFTKLSIQMKSILHQHYYQKKFQCLSSLVKWCDQYLYCTQSLMFNCPNLHQALNT